MRAHCLVLLVALAGCSPPRDVSESTRKATIVGAYGAGAIYKICDEGRAIYASKNNSSGGIAVIENAPECAQ